MSKYLLKRLLLFFPTLFVISVFTFYISSNAPGDPVEAMLSKNGSVNQQEYTNLKKRLGLDLPLFYFSITDATQPDTLYKINDRTTRSQLEQLYFEIGNKKLVSQFYIKIERLLEEAKHLNILISQEALLVSDVDDIEKELIRISKNYSPLSILCEDAKAAIVKMKTDKKVWVKYIPAFHFYGFNNQYNNWIKNILEGDFGISYQDKRPVFTVIREAIGITLTISILSILCSLIISIPLGVYSAWLKNSLFDKFTSSALFALFSIPNFWMSTLLILLFAGGDYWDWFPSHGISSNIESKSNSSKLSDVAIHLILPIICLMYGSIAIITRQLRSQMIHNLNSNYIKAVKAKGVSNTVMLWKHALRNSLLPLITITATMLPLAISGSFVIEYIFSIPGMGKLSYEALMARNYPIVYSVVIFTATISLITNLIADLLYAWADPRIKYN